ncbi:MAG: phosphodiester glycosidase family protein [Bacteroidota bacterium]
MRAFRFTGLRRIILILAALLIFLAGLTYAAINIWPSMGATAVELMRAILGNRVVAVVEDAALKTQDKAHQLAYKVAGKAPEAGWTAGEAQPGVVGQPSWSPPPANALLKKGNEAQWQPFIAINQQVVAYRTLIYPDPQRPYASAAVVAFDLHTTRLHFLLGTQEPKSGVQVARPGRIPSEDRRVGWLLAAFNGGFKAEHGHFGVMVDGVTVIPPLDNMGTVGLYSDGTVRMGLLGQEVRQTADLAAWRQNGPLVIQNGQINPLTNSVDPADWGYVVGGGTATDRSALGISQDGRTLYYLVGTDLTLPSVAGALQAVQAYQAIQLDINNYWTHFDSFPTTGPELKAVPLLSFMKNIDDQRFLGSYLRDFFYVTAR